MLTKKTLLLTLEYPPQKGGVSVYLENLVKEYNDNEIIILTNKSPNAYIYDLTQNYKIIRRKLIALIGWPKWKRSYKITKKVVKEHDVSHLIISHVLPMGYIALLLNIPYTVVLHGLDLNLARSKPLKNFFLKIILNKANKIIVNSKYTKNELNKVGGYDNKVKVKYPKAKQMNTNIVQSEIAKIKKKYSINNKFTLLSVNRLVSRKGNDITIKALAELKQEKDFDFQYLIIGNGAYQVKLEKLIKRYNLGNNIKIINNITDEELPVFYKLSDLFIMPARVENDIDYEGFGIVFLEADQFDLPIIAGDTGGVPEAISMVKKGVLVDPVNIDNIKTQILKIYEQKN